MSAGHLDKAHLAQQLTVPPTMFTCMTSPRIPSQRRRLEEESQIDMQESQIGQIKQDVQLGDERQHEESEET